MVRGGDDLLFSLICHLGLEMLVMFCHSISPNSDNVPAASSHYLSIYQGSNCLTIFSLTSDLSSKNSHSVTADQLD